MEFVLFILSLLSPPADYAFVRQLGSDDFATRQNAGVSLRSRGLAALPALDAASDSDDAEVRRSALNIYEGILAPLLLPFDPEPSDQVIQRFLADEALCNDTSETAVGLGLVRYRRFVGNPYWDTADNPHETVRRDLWRLRLGILSLSWLSQSMPDAD